MFTEEVEKQIFDIIHQKGWNLYKSTNSTKIGANEVIKRFLADKLEVGERYVLLPKADDPKDPSQVMGALEKLAVKTNRSSPSIEVDGARYPWTGFIPYSDRVKINTIVGHHTSYQEFISALETITPAS